LAEIRGQLDEIRTSFNEFNDSKRSSTSKTNVTLFVGRAQQMSRYSLVNNLNPGKGKGKGKGKSKDKDDKEPCFYWIKYGNCSRGPTCGFNHAEARKASHPKATFPEAKASAAVLADPCSSWVQAMFQDQQ
jgi:hypothetical protein